MLRKHDSLRECCVSLTLLLCVTGAASYPSSSANAAEGGGAAAGVGNRIDALGQLLNHSSAATQITNSGDAAALAKHKAAKEIYERALDAHRRGDEDGAKRLLDEASRTLFEAVRLAKPETVVGDKKRADYNTRLESLNQMLAAFERIRKEKHSDAGSHEVNGQLKEKLARAKALFAAGQLDEARAALDQAYASARLAMEKLHGGDTVTRSLNFSSKEEEYRYELDRNNTHRILLTGLLDEKANRPELRQQTQTFVDRAAELRQQAESAGASKDYEQAIKTLEESTTELIRAIRAAGVYIPG
jgi:tetratricopeptide (TPR) repeat protein